MKAKNDLVSLLDNLVNNLQKYPTNQVFQKILLEATWLKQELDRGNLELPFKGIGEVSMVYHLSEGDFDDIPVTKKLVEEVLQCLGA